MQPNKPECKGCAVQQGYVPAGAVMQINESTPDALRYAAALECDEHEGRRKAAACLRAQHARIAELESQLAAAQQGVQPIAWAAVYFGGKRAGKIYTTLETEQQCRDYIAQVHQSDDSITLTAKPVYTHPTTQELDAQIIQALSAGMSIEQWQSSVDVRIGSSDLLGRAIASGEETRIELVRRAVSEVFAAQAKQGGV